MFKWVPGRQDSGYFKLKIFESAFLKCDCYIIKFPKGSIIDEHVDPVINGYEHHRLNIVLKRARAGGTFFVKRQNSSFFTACRGRIIKFRPDIERHYASKIKLGTRYLISFGWLKRRN